LLFGDIDLQRWQYEPAHGRECANGGEIPTMRMIDSLLVIVDALPTQFLQLLRVTYIDVRQGETARNGAVFARFITSVGA
jgi:hypothetical protein